MSAFLTMAAILAPTALGLWWLHRWDRRQGRCRVYGCRRDAAAAISMWHPAGRTELAVCEGHAHRFNAPPYDQQLDGTDLGRLNLDAEQ